MRRRTTVMTETERIRIAEGNLVRLLEWIARIDGKSSVVLGVNTGMLGVLAGLAPLPSQWTWLMTITACICGALLSASLICIYFVNYPQTRGSQTSLNFFGGIAARTFREYQEAFLKHSATDHLNDTLEQCHRNAEIVKAKFEALKLAYRFLLASMPPWVAVIFLFKTIPNPH